MMSPRFLVLSVLPLIVVACGGETVNVGSSSQQELKKTTNGGATGNGQTCSFDDVVWYDAETGQSGTIPSATGQYGVGEDFKSPDGCNDCTCTTNGIMCTVKACSSPPNGGGGTGGGQACTEEAKQCPDGSYVSRTGPNCEFAPCPGGDPGACPAIARVCNDGSTATAGPNCTQTCPEDSNVACPADAKLCPDGKTYVSRTGPNCAFAPCP